MTICSWRYFVQIQSGWERRSINLYSDILGVGGLVVHQPSVKLNASVRTNLTTDGRTRSLIEMWERVQVWVERLKAQGLEINTNERIGGWIEADGTSDEMQGCIWKDSLWFTSWWIGSTWWWCSCFEVGIDCRMPRARQKKEGWRNFHLLLIEGEPVQWARRFPFDTSLISFHSVLYPH